MNNPRSIKFTYLYRDAGNFKQWGEVIFANPENLSNIEIDVRLRKAFDQECLFVAHQIDLPEVFLYTNGNVTADDHCFHEYDSVEFSTAQPTDPCGRSIKSFLERVERESQLGWLAFNPIDKVFGRRV